MANVINEKLVQALTLIEEARVLAQEAAPKFEHAGCRRKYEQLANDLRPNQGLSLSSLRHYADRLVEEL